MNIIEEQNKFIKDLEQMILDECKKYNINKDTLPIYLDDGTEIEKVKIDALVSEIKRKCIKEMNISDTVILKRDQVLHSISKFPSFPGMENTFIFIEVKLFSKKLGSMSIIIKMPEEDTK